MYLLPAPLHLPPPPERHRPALRHHLQPPTAHLPLSPPLGRGQALTIQNPAAAAAAVTVTASPLINRLPDPLEVGLLTAAAFVAATPYGRDRTGHQPMEAAPTAAREGKLQLLR